MMDSWGRTIDYLRISVTDRCNLRCIYCMPESGVPSLSHTEILTYEEILRIVTAGAGLGIKKIKLTGGEPLVRKDLAQLVAWVKQTPGIESVTLTTNGILLESQLKDLVNGGLDGINISLDTLDASDYEKITRRGHIKDVLSGLKSALNSPRPLNVKINCVPVKSDSDHLLAMAKLTKMYPVHVRFIEVMPVGLGKNFDFVSENQILEVLTQAFGSPSTVTDSLGNGPCHYYSFPGFSGKIGFISAISHKFCDQCNRVRLTADGYLKTCLQYDTGVSLKTLMRNGCDDDQLSKAIQQAINSKPRAHHFRQEGQTLADEDEKLSMFQIGG